MGPQVRTYSDYLRATREAEKEDSIELSQNSRIQASDGPSKPRTTSFFPLRKLKGNQPFPNKPAMWLAQWEEEDTDDGEEQESDDPDGIKGVMEEFMVQLDRVVKDTQMDEKHCYHCSCSEHFIHNCPLMKTTRDKKQLNWKEGMAMTKGDQTPPLQQAPKRAPRRRLRRHETTFADSLLESKSFSAMVWNREHGQSEDKWGSCLALLDNGAQVNTIMPRYVKEHSLQVGPITNLMGSKVTCVGLGNAYTRLLGYVVIQVQVDGVWGYDEDQRALVIPEFFNFANRVPIILGTLTIG